MVVLLSCLIGGDVSFIEQIPYVKGVNEEGRDNVTREC